MPHRVAIIADAHFHDPTGDFGAGLTVGGRRLALRSWQDTETGPRAVNETAGALTAALARITAAGIRHVILAGDYTDDGQAENTRALAELLARHDGLRFYAIPGNHDLYGPHGKHVTTRLVTGPDTTALVTSDPAMGQEATITPAMRCAGQPAALMPMARFGLFRQPEYLHWESPFGPSDAPDDRIYDATAADGSVTHRLMDASYLVEPEPGLWILMIDANVFEPRPGRTDPARKKAFLDASDAGWNAVLRIKPFLLPWIADVVARAKGHAKTLVTVSHYPVLDAFQDHAGSERALFGETAIVRRTPSPKVATALIATGLRWHAGGHMHVNAVTRQDGFTDIAIPSLAAFPPGFRIITATPDSALSETVLLDDLPPDPDLQAAYVLQGRTSPPLPYGPFLAAQFRAHLVTRVLPRHWPPDLMAWIKDADCADLLTRLAPPDKATGFAVRHNLPPAALGTYPLAAMLTDADLIRAAGPLARGYVEPLHLRICQAFAQDFGDAGIDPQLSQMAFIRRFLSVLQVSLRRMGNTAHPTDHGLFQES
jgi:3',5'-cyclic AMP phosphodiesterase CpdA